VCSSSIPSTDAQEATWRTTAAELEWLTLLRVSLSRQHQQQIKTVDKEIFTAVRSQSNTQARSR
jgi:hypothetical protein